MNYTKKYETLLLMYQQFGGTKKKWKTLVHNGVVFPPEYIKHNIPIYYDNKPIILDKLSEEYATYYAKYLDSKYINNKFNKNFWNDWKQILNKNPNNIIKEFDKVDFTEIKNYIIKEKENKKLNNTSKSENDTENIYAYAYIDGKKEPVGNYRVEPAGIFLGRGNHPKSGCIKRRIYPEDITLNLDKTAPIPETLPNHKWKQIIHDRTVDWLASWKDDITGKTKYVWLGAQSSNKGEKDMLKFNMARKLKKIIKDIRHTNIQNMNGSDEILRQISCALYLIDTFALRVGNEKSSDEADTVGVASLRVEHITLLDDNNIKLDFLGKDSIRYTNISQVLPIIYTNLKTFMKNKNIEEPIFDKITSSDINKYLQTFMKDLTAKVFRTYNASHLFSKELRKITNKYNNYTDPDKEKILLEEYNKANIKVAKLCNHQKAVSSSHEAQIEKINNEIAKLKTELDTDIKPEKRKKIKNKINILKAKKNMKSELKNISLGTSKINYIDPRITIAFIKQNKLNINKYFTKTLQDKFKWAMDVSPDYKF